MSTDSHASIEQLQSELEKLRTENTRLKAQVQLQDSQDCETIIRKTINAFWIVDMQGKFQYVNDAYCELIGYSREELLTMGLDSIEASESPEQIKAHMEKIITTGADRFQTKHRCKNGDLIEIEITANYIPQNGGRFCSFIHDLTEFRRAETRLQTGLEHYRTLVSNFPGVIYRCLNDADWTMLYMSDTAQDVLGYTSDDIVQNHNRSFNSIIHPEDRQHVHRTVQDAIDRDAAYTIEYRIIQSDETEIWVQDNGRGDRDQEGHIHWLDGALIDITERVLAQQAIRQSEIRFRELVQRMSSGVAVYRAMDDGEDFVFVDFNPASERIENVSRDDIIGRKVTDAFPGVKQFGLFEVFQRVWRTGEPEYCPVTLYQDNRISGYRDNFVYRLPSEEIVAVYNDHTERMQALEALRESERYFRSLLESMHEEILVIDRNYKVCDVNGAFTTSSGMTRADVIDQPCFVVKHKLDHPCEAMGDECPLHDVFSSGKPRNCLHVHKNDDGTQRWVDILMSPLLDSDGNVTSVIEAARDVTEMKNIEQERHQLELQLRHAQKMDAIGQLAGGIAHDFNNLLTAIFGNLEMLDAIIPESDETKQSLKGIRQAADQAAGVTKSLLTFSHKLPTQKRVLNLQHVIEQSTRLLGRLIPAMVELKTSIEPTGSLYAFADETHLQQVVMNLAVNACDAMPDGGNLSIQLSHCVVLKNLQLPDTEHPHGYIVLKTSDTGSGIKPEVLERIYEPFFTTKPRGSGTGLGLAIVHGVVQDHGGIIHVESTIGQGTTFTVILPAAAPDESMDTQQDNTIPQMGHGQLIIIAEDDHHVREVIAAYLVQQNYRIVQAENGEELVELYREHAQDVSLLLVDYEMPRLNGLKSLETIRKMGSMTPAIIVTAHVSKDLENQLDSYTTMYRKPFQLAELTRAVAVHLAQQTENNRE